MNELQSMEGPLRGTQAGWLWRCYYAFLVRVQNSGVRNSPLAAKGFSLLNRMGRLGLLLFLSRRTWKVRGNVMYLARRGSTNVGVTLRLLLGTYEEGTTTLFEKVLKPGMSAVDLGAHIGYFTLLAARLVGPNGKVYAFEPEPGNFQVLQANVRLNGLQNVVLLPEAISDATGCVKLNLSPWGSDRHSVGRSAGRPGSTIDVPCTTIDDFLRRLNLSHIDLLKMDIEGSEPAALAGMREALAAGWIRNLIIEFNPSVLDLRAGGSSAVLESLHEAGFRLWEIADDGPPEELPAARFENFIRALRREQRTVNLFCASGAASWEGWERSVLPGGAP